MSIVSRHSTRDCSFCCSLEVLGGVYTTSLIRVASTPWAVPPPLSAPAGQGATHGGAYCIGNRIRPVARLHSGLARASAVPTPGKRPVVSDVCALALVSV